MGEIEVRTRLLERLSRVAGRLPNGLLHRLVEDAQFFHEWNMGKRRARGAARAAQRRAWEAKAEERYWRDVRRQN